MALYYTYEICLVKKLQGKRWLPLHKHQNEGSLDLLTLCLINKCLGSGPSWVYIQVKVKGILCGRP